MYGFVPAIGAVSANASSFVTKTSAPARRATLSRRTAAEPARRAIIVAFDPLEPEKNASDITAYSLDKSDTVQEQQVKGTQSSPFPTLEKNRELKEKSDERGPQGFTSYAELVNGRLAALGFVIGLVTEIFSKDHLTIGQQILLLVSPITHAVQSITG
jgi:hypothetical protein